MPPKKKPPKPPLAVCDLAAAYIVADAANNDFLNGHVLALYLKNQCSKSYSRQHPANPVSGYK